MTNDVSTTYSYDQNGNRTISGYTTGTDNELTTDGTYNYSYDAEGNLIQKVSVSGPTTTWTYSYSVTNQLVGSTETGKRICGSYFFCSICDIRNSCERAPGVGNHEY